MIIKNAKVALSNENDFKLLDVKIHQGKISQVGKNLSGENEIDATGMFLFPGAIDPHVHFDDPGYTQREDFYHGSCSAVSGGVTTVIDMPCTSIPPVTNLENLKRKLNVIKKKSVVDFGLFGGISAQSFSKHKNNMSELAEFVMGFKTYFISGMPTFERLNYTQFADVLEFAKKLNQVVLLHAEDYDYIKKAEPVEKLKGSSWKNYYNSRPEEAEIIAVKNAVSIAEKADANLHIVHIGTAKAGELLRDKNRITGETEPHYLEFNFDDLERIGGALKTKPVVKKRGNSEKLWKMLENGMINFVASDHAPAPVESKSAESVWDIYCGIPGSGTLFPYLYSEGFVKRKIKLSRFLEIVSENSAKRYGFFDRKGSIEVGKDADLIMLDPNKKWIVKGDKFYSKGKITPFENKTFQGRIVKTIIRGEVVYDIEKGIVQEAGFGEFIRALPQSR
ncbi:MAG: dihydroorotase [Candidatus Marinimicrobia bacterium]|nr:dihydroorotase [Candidatus Neomarinimicrobiota bacterium]